MKVEIIITNKVRFKLLEDYMVMGYVIPAGYSTDFASVPKSLWNILPPIGKHNEAALLHDWLYDNRIGTRKDADKLFLRSMRINGVRWISAQLMYLGVRIGGRKWWKN